MKQLKMAQYAFAAVAAGTVALSQSAFAGAHTWRVNEAFSNPSGTIQFIELRECCGGNFETNIGGLQVRSQSTGNAFTFPGNLFGPTGNAHLLLATQAFANLPGAPVVDFIIPAGFFNPNGDTLSYHVYDSWVIGAVPQNCVNSLHRNVGSAPNSPTNFGGQTGQVNSCPGPACPADFVPPGGDGNVNVNDLLGVINSWGACPAPCGADVSPPGGDGTVNVNDLLAVINNWGPCK